MARETSNPLARRGRPFCEQHIREWKSSGLNQAEYSRQHGLNQQSFSNWKRRLGGAESGPSVRFVELPTSTVTAAGSGPLFEFRLDEDLRVSFSFRLSPEIMRDMFGGRG